MPGKHVSKLMRNHIAARSQTPSLVAAEVTRLTLAERNVGQSEPPYVGCYFFNGLLTFRLARWEAECARLPMRESIYPGAVCPGSRSERSFRTSRAMQKRHRSFQTSRFHILRLRLSSPWCRRSLTNLNSSR